MVQHSCRPTVKLSRRLKGTRLWSGTASSTKLLFKNAAIQPVGWSAMLAGHSRGHNRVEVLIDPVERPHFKRDRLWPRQAHEPV